MRAPSSTVLRLIKTNEALSEEEEIAIRADMKAFLDSSSSDDVDDLNGDLSSFIDAHKKVLSPTRRLPTEILSNIFYLTHASVSYDQSIFFDAAKSPIWRLTHVCSRWRAIICESMHWLWAKISLDKGSSSRHLSSRYPAMLECCLGRAGDYPLTLRFGTMVEANRLWYVDRDQKAEADRLWHIDQTRCLDLLISACHRWRRVTVSSSISVPLASQLRQVSGRLDLLQELHIIGDLPQAESILELFGPAPHLKYLEVSARKFAPHPSWFPWSSLEIYRCSHTDPEALLIVLRLASNLITLTATEIPYITSAEQTLRCVRHPALRKLTVRSCFLLRYLDLPALVYLEISLRANYQLGDLGLLAAFQPITKIQHLTVTGALGGKLKFDFLARASSLTVLTLAPVSSLQEVSTLFQELSKRDACDRPVSASYLHTLIIHLSYTKSPEALEELTMIDTLSHMLDLRFRGPAACLTKLVFHMPQPQIPRLTNLFRDFAELGLRCHISYSDRHWAGFSKY